jgi:hypothetical protein
VFLELAPGVAHGSIGPRVRELARRVRARLGDAAEWTQTREGQRRL